MKLARVVGTVVATQKDPGLCGRKLLIIQPLNEQLTSSGSQLVAIDTVGAGVDEIVMFAAGSSARQTEQTRDTPCDCVIMAIIDLVEVKGSIVFRKQTEGV